MVIIDFHTHLMDEGFPPGPFWEGWVRVGAVLSGRPPEVLRERVKEMWDISGEKLVREMDEAGIDKAVIIALDWGMHPGIGEGKYSLEELHNILAGAVKAYPDRFILFASIDPRRANAASWLERAVKEYGARGFKLHPAVGFYPNDRMVYPLYRKAAQLDIPVMIHTGPETPPLYSKYCLPVYVDDVATDFPDLTLIMAHSGLGWWEEAASVAAMKPNVYLDLAGWQPRLRRNPLDFYRTVRNILDTVGASRVLFGSDWPVLKLLVSEARWVQAFQQLPQEVREAGIEFKDWEVRAVLGENAKRILKL